MQQRRIQLPNGISPESACFQVIAGVLGQLDDRLINGGIDLGAEVNELVTRRVVKEFVDGAERVEVSRVGIVLDGMRTPKGPKHVNGHTEYYFNLGSGRVKVASYYH